MVAAAEPPERLILPDLLQGEWTSVVVVTYGADLSFWESRLLGQLAQVRLRAVLADHQRLAARLQEAAETGQRLRGANRSYLAGPIRHPRAAHAKAILLTNKEKGLLVVGSGNLGYDGYASPGELWHVFAYSDDQREHIPEFAAFRAMLDGLVHRGAFDPPTTELLDSIWHRCPWLPAHPEAARTVVHNLSTPLLDQLAAKVTWPVEHLIVHAPFHDRDCAALAELLARFTPRQVRVLLTRDTSVDIDRLTAVLAAAPRAECLLVEVDTDPATYLHAKWVHLIGAKKAAVLTGSANLSRSALLRSADTGNIELGVLTVGARREFDRLYAPLSMTPIDDLHDLGIAFRTEPEPVEESTRPALLWSQLEGTTLTLTFDQPVEATLIRSIHGAAGPLDLRQLVAEGTTLFVSLTPEDAAAIADGGHLDICMGDGDPVSVSTWPYHLALLWARLAHPTNRDVICGIAPFPERDAELFDLLRQLEATLIFDPVTAWHTAEPDSDPEPTAGDEQIPRWQDLDWQRIRHDPRYAGYHDTGPNRSTAPTAVQIMLAAISGKLAELVPPDPMSPRPPGPGENEDDLAVSPTETTPEEEEPDKPSPPPPGTKTRKAFNRFVSRYAAATRDPAFLDELGPVLTVRNAVIFNHLLIQLLGRQIVDPARAIDAQLAVWQRLWGGSGEPGLLDRLEGEERDAALRVLDEAHTRTTTLQALVHAVDYDLDRDLRHHLRDMATWLIIAPRFNLDAQLLEAAAPTPAQASALLDNLELLAGQLDRHDIADFVLEPLHCTYHDVEWKPEIVPRPSMITGKAYEYHTTTLVVHRTIVGLDPQAVRAALERFAVATTRPYASQDYWRIRFTGNGNDVGYWDAACGRGLTMVNWDDQEFETFAPAWPRWRVQLDGLRSTLAPRRQSA